MDSKKEDYKKKPNDPSRTTMPKKNPHNINDSQKPGPSRKEYPENNFVKTVNEPRQSFMEFRRQGIPYLMSQSSNMSRPKLKPIDSILSPKEVLDCSYLRLSGQKIKELEEACRERGIEPGIHKHMTNEELSELEIFEKYVPDDSPTEKKGSRHRVTNSEQRSK